MAIQIEKLENFRWTPVRARPRCEKKVAEFCKGNHIVHYLPLIKKVHRYDRRTVEFFVPMFSGYVFCLLSEENYRVLVLSNAVAFKLNMDDAAENLLIEELKSIQVFEKLALEKEVIVKPELVEGVKVKVTGGPLMGTEGFVEKRKGKTTVSVNIDILGQSVSTVVDAGDLEVDD